MIKLKNAAAFEVWLAKNAGSHAGVWLKLAKKGSGIASLTDAEAVDVGLCFGWISGQRKALDDDYYLQKYVPRRPRSLWSQVNVAKVEQLIASGRMRAQGLKEVEAAKADGRWAAAYAGQRIAEAPLELLAALGRDALAKRNFDALGRGGQYAFIHRIITARSASAREARIRDSISQLSQLSQLGGAKAPARKRARTNRVK